MVIVLLFEPVTDAAALACAPALVGIAKAMQSAEAQAMAIALREVFKEWKWFAIVCLVVLMAGMRVKNTEGDRANHGSTTGLPTASLREDYLNQVQRDFLSRPEALQPGQHP